MDSDLAGFFGRMFPDCSLARLRASLEDPISSPSSVSWTASGLLEGGQLLTLDTSDWPSGGPEFSACSLREVLEPAPHPRYFLSPRACQGVLRRAEKRGKVIPPELAELLKAVASRTPSKKATDEGAEAGATTSSRSSR